MNKALLAFSLVILWCGPALSGKLYKWVDEDGTVKYSQTPPKDRDYTTIEKKMKSSLGKEVQQAPTLPTEDEDTKTPEQRFVESRKQNCDAAKQNQKVLSSTGNIRGMDGKLLSDKQKQEQVKLAKEQVKIYCQASE